MKIKEAERIIKEERIRQRTSHPVLCLDFKEDDFEIGKLKGIGKGMIGISKHQGVSYDYEMKSIKKIIGLDLNQLLAFFWSYRQEKRRNMLKIKSIACEVSVLEINFN